MEVKKLDGNTGTKAITQDGNVKTAKMIQEDRELLAEAFNERSWKERLHMEIFRVEGFGKPNNQRAYGVNWSGIGTTSVKDTEIFQKNLGEAIALCKTLNEGLVD
jgi:hypothetical protein